jgi:hypothetical protein
MPSAEIIEEPVPIPVWKFAYLNRTPIEGLVLIDGVVTLMLFPQHVIIVKAKKRQYPNFHP